MSDLPIEKMDFKKLRREVQALRDELAMMKRHYEDLLYNLDDDNIVSVSADKIKGLVVDSVTTDSLYAEYGDIADLTVDMISTSKKVRKYLMGDTSDDIFFEGHDNGIFFVQGVVLYGAGEGEEPAPLAERLYNRYGEALSWNGTVSYTSGGYAYDEDGNRLLITSKTGGTPVTVYRYKKNIKLSVSFYDRVTTTTQTVNGEEVTTTSIVATPRIALGIGTDATGQTSAGKAFIEKTDTGVEIQYYTENGAQLKALRLTDSGAFQVRGADAYPVPVLHHYDNEADAQADTKLVNGDWYTVEV